MANGAMVADPNLDDASAHAARVTLGIALARLGMFAPALSHLEQPDGPLTVAATDGATAGEAPPQPTPIGTAASAAARCRRGAISSSTSSSIPSSGRRASHSGSSPLGP